MPSTEWWIDPLQHEHTLAWFLGDARRNMCESTMQTRNEISTPLSNASSTRDRVDGLKYFVQALGIDLQYHGCTRKTLDGGLNVSARDSTHSA
jgi:hypothetical protein